MTIDRNIYALGSDEHELLLEGSPRCIPSVWHTDCAAADHMKIPGLRGREHYEFSGRYFDLDGRRLPLFQWVYTTRIAE